MKSLSCIFILGFLSTLSISCANEKALPTSGGLDFSSIPIFLAQWNSPGQGASSFTTIGGIVLDSDRNIFLCDTGNNRIDKFDSDGNFLLGWGSSGLGPGQFGRPSGIAWLNGMVYVSDSGNNRIQVFDSYGNAITLMGSAGSAVSQLNNPQGLAVDPNGNVYVADSGNDRIQVFHPGGAAPTTWGTAGSGNGQFNFPEGVALDSAYNVYVADTFNNRIQKFSASGTYENSWGGIGSDPGQLRSPWGLTFDGSGFLYVADSANGRIQKFDTNGNVLTQWGGIGASLSQFQTPKWIAITPAPYYFFVSDFGANVVKKYGPPANYAIFPNPVMPSQELTISFNSASFVGYSIQITDFNNAVVFSNQGEAVAGNNAVQWNCLSSGNRVPAGIYLLHLNLGHSVIDEKISVVN